MPGLYRQRTLEGWGLRHDGGYDEEEYEGLRRATCSFFLEKKKEPKKNRLAVLPNGLLSLDLGVTGFFIREAARVCCFKMLTRYESAAFLWYYYLRLTRFGILGVSGYRESSLPV